VETQQEDLSMTKYEDSCGKSVRQSWGWMNKAKANVAIPVVQCTVL